MSVRAKPLDLGVGNTLVSLFAQAFVWFLYVEFSNNWRPRATASLVSFDRSEQLWRRGHLSTPRPLVKTVMTASNLKRVPINGCRFVAVAVARKRLWAP